MERINIGDIVVECEGEPIETVDDNKNKKTPGDTIVLKLYRKGQYIDVSVILGEEMLG